MAGPGPAGPASEFADAWRQTGSLVALREAIEAGARVRHVVARRAGLSDSELIALQHLVRTALGPAELARILDISTAASTGVVDRLAERGHVERHPHAEDRRRTDVRVTASGREEVLAHLLPMFTALDTWDRSFTDAERALVERYLRGVREAFERVAGPAAPAQPPPSEA
ncbi:MarR family transcriptional regulator [Nocardioides sp.]|uniref:MarR family winged helix-turn-helix transcriptional regulator n=1 Tax=Nocardioides sp. TaxID=35761 RepID=UPI002624136A|nr:MarR family transcriptional regulator [Nocardioides sp.]MDI6912346.1 MarR family transcriptional regulator [Nocardioides sp.]